MGLETNAPAESATALSLPLLLGVAVVLEGRGVASGLEGGVVHGNKINTNVWHIKRGSPTSNRVLHGCEVLLWPAGKVVWRKSFLKLAGWFYKRQQQSMFLTKKSGPLTSKTKAPPKNKPLAGWEDDEESPTHHNIKQSPLQVPVPQVNLLEDNPQSTALTQQIQRQSAAKQLQPPREEYAYYDWNSLNQRTDIECDKKLVEDIVQAGGIRIKPNESQLSDFLKEVRGLEINNIGSLLLSKLEVNYPFQVKAKALYTIEHLIKKNHEFLDYFRFHQHKIRDFPEPEDNLENYRKIQKAVLNLIEPHQEQPSTAQNKRLTYVDPGYYQQPPKSQLTTFIEANAHKTKKADTKKQIIGPGQAKAKLLEKKWVKPAQSGQDNEVGSKPKQEESDGVGNLLGLESLDLNPKANASNNDDLLI